ncbi:alpha/beta fold hydrolase [Agromyces sp. MMS17-SY077]|uniref:Alpha/beta fold hydrolase n=2 Tax=Agromyces seonyuensis TaxID=2662446 RepID=A0A6I4P0R9_9MICO|nr:alpha/beta hydrolase [Agromyces seonyuensis]MWC00244.1 alpha/beta fold hydrolase [Agromyces seonyuensis]
MAEVAGWRPDVLGPGFEQRTLPLGDDDIGPIVATVVRYTGRHRPLGGLVQGADVLYVHGWNDYFFNPELARFWAGLGARFHALDLRNYGRSLRPGRSPGYITDITTYDADLEAALGAIGHGQHDDPKRPLVLVGHSTGGLVLSLWAARYPGRADRLVLNSPWLEFQASRVGREAIAPALNLAAMVRPTAVMPNVDYGFYARSIDKNRDGQWEYDHSWRLDAGAPTHPAWLAAIFAGQSRVAAGLDIGVPVLTLLSKRSLIQPRWSDEMLRSDIVLVVDEIAARSVRLGPDVTIARIDGALHDVFLSFEPARQAAYDAVERWLRGASTR